MTDYKCDETFRCRQCYSNSSYGSSPSSNYWHGKLLFLSRLFLCTVVFKIEVDYSYCIFLFHTIDCVVDVPLNMIEAGH